MKLGLLSTVLDAQRAIFERGEDTKIFVIPLVVSYHFVLEAPFLIEQHLRRMGKERYVKSKDGAYSFRRVLKFIWRLFSESNDIILSFGQPLNVLGDPVDAEGNSFDQYGNPIDVKDYFKSDGKVTEDAQRESEYTKILAEKIVERFHKDNIVLTSHLVAFAAFEILRKENNKLDLYALLRLPTDEYVFKEDLLTNVVGQLQERLMEMEQAGEILLSDQMRWPVDKLIYDGVARLGSFHVSKPLRYNKKGQVISDSFKNLYFYHNRMENYDLDKMITWPILQSETV